MKCIVEIPEKVDVKIDKKEILVKGPMGELRKKIKFGKIISKIEDKKAVFQIESQKTAEKAVCGSAAAHLKKMINGVLTGYKYKMKIIYAHFPINVSIDGRKVIIKNFFGEKTPRHAEIFGNVKVEVKGQDIFASGPDAEEVGQTCARIEQAARVRNKDTRVFQDGIYLVSRGEEE